MKLNIMPKQVLECGLAEDVDEMTVGNSGDSPESNFTADHESDADLEQIIEKNFKGNSKTFQKEKQRKSAHKESEGHLSCAQRMGLVLSCHTIL